MVFSPFVFVVCILPSVPGYSKSYCSHNVHKDQRRELCILQPEINAEAPKEPPFGSSRCGLLTSPLPPHPNHPYLRQDRTGPTCQLSEGYEAPGGFPRSRQPPRQEGRCAFRRLLRCRCPKWMPPGR